jgi:hypothetical protein
MCSVQLFAVAAVAAAAVSLWHHPVDGSEKSANTTLLVLSQPQHVLCALLLLLQSSHTSRWIGLSGNRS